MPEKIGRKPDGTLGAMSGSCKLHFDSVSPEIAERLHRTGVAVVPIPVTASRAPNGRLGS